MMLVRVRLPRARTAGRSAPADDEERVVGPGAGGMGAAPSGVLVKLQLALLREVIVWVSDSSAICEVCEAV